MNLPYHPVALLCCTLLFANAPCSYADYGPECPATLVEIAQSPPSYWNQADWSKGGMLAYDYLNRDPTSPAAFDTGQLEKMGKELQAALDRLPDESSKKRKLLTPYIPLVAEVAFTDAVRAQLLALAPPAGTTRVKGLRLPLAFSDGLGRLCAEVCGCWLDVRTNRETVDVSFKPRANLFHAVRELQKLAEVSSARLRRNEFRIGPNATGPTVPADSLAVRIDSDRYYFTADTTDEAGHTSTQIFEVTKGGAQPRPVSASEEDKARPRAIPDSMWSGAP